MSDNGKPAELTDLMKVMRSLNENVTALARQMGDKAKHKQSHYGPPFPPTDAMGAFGPMMMAWALSWLYANPRSEPMMLGSMAQFAESREKFWHHSMDLLAEMARRSEKGSVDIDNYPDPAISNEIKLKVVEALKAQNVQKEIVDCVQHSMNLVDYFKQYRGDPHKHFP